MNTRKIGSIGLALLAAACATDSTGPRGVATGNVALSFGAMPASPGTGDAKLAASLTSSTRISGDTLIVFGGQDTMRITEVLLTIEEIELERDGQTADCSSSSASVASSASFRHGADDPPGDDSRDGVDDSSDDCEDHVGGPVFVNLHLDGQGTSQIEVPAVLGVYDTLQFDFDVADEDNTASAAYRSAHPEMANASARITGTFNGSPFQIKLDSRLKYEIALTMPLVVSESSTGFELGIQVDVGGWLTRPDGSIINPATLCSLGTRCTDREIIEANMDNARVRADGRSRGN